MEKIIEYLENDIDDVLKNIGSLIIEIGNNLDKDLFIKKGDNIWISKKAIIDETSRIIGPAIVYEDCKLEFGSYVRENVIIGPSSTIGHCCEVKNSILLNHDVLAHYNYVGDSILYNNVHLGAGAIISNLKLDRSNINGLRKKGAIIGNNVEIGCNSVLCPGVIIGDNVNIYPLCVVRGLIPSNVIVKNDKMVEKDKFE